MLGAGPPLGQALQNAWDKPALGTGLQNALDRSALGLLGQALQNAWDRSALGTAWDIEAKCSWVLGLLLGQDSWDRSEQAFKMLGTLSKMKTGLEDGGKEGVLLQFSIYMHMALITS